MVQSRVFSGRLELGVHTVAGIVGCRLVKRSNGKMASQVHQEVFCKLLSWLEGQTIATISQFARSGRCGSSVFVVWKLLKFPCQIYRISSNLKVCQSLLFVTDKSMILTESGNKSAVLCARQDCRAFLVSIGKSPVKASVLYGTCASNALCKVKTIC